MNQVKMTRKQRATILNGVSLIVILVVVLQLWLITATMDAWRGGDKAPVWPATLASAGCFIVNALLVKRVMYLDRSGAQNGRGGM